MTRRNIYPALCLFTLAALLFCACGSAPRPSNEGQPAASESPAAQATPAGAAPVSATPASPEPTKDAGSHAPPPTAAEVRAALERTYKGAVTFDGRMNAAAVGDFNGDDSQDLMVEVRPAPGHAAELNDELANWIVTNPLNVRPPDPRNFDPHQGVQKLEPSEGRPHIEQTDALLVVVHGYKEAGWRDPAALQTFLLKNVAGTDLRPEAQAEAAAHRRQPRLLGDVLHETLGGAHGFLYWTGAGYGWFKVDDER